MTTKYIVTVKRVDTVEVEEADRFLTKSTPTDHSDGYGKKACAEEWEVKNVIRRRCTETTEYQQEFAALDLVAVISAANKADCSGGTP
jgi:hypothetical protein